VKESEAVNGHGHNGQTFARAQAGSLREDLARLFPLTLADTVSLIGAFVLVRYIAIYLSVQGGQNIQAQWSNIGFPLTFILMSVTLLWLLRKRDPSIPLASTGEWTRIVGAVSFASMFSAVIGILVTPQGYHPQLAVLAWTFSILFLIGGEFTADKAIHIMRNFRSGRTKVIIIGGSDKASIARQRFEAEWRRYTVAGIVNLGDENPNGNGNGSTPNLGDISSLPQIVDDQINGNGAVMVALPAKEYSQVELIVASRPSTRARVRVALYPLSNDVQDGVASGAVWQSRRFSFWYETFKRAFDILIALTSLIIASPLIIATAILIKLDSPGPIFFGQTRVGRGGQLFKMWKFRSMRPNAEALLAQLEAENEAAGAMFKMADDPRITRVGRVIRRLSLDELPQLFNVLQGTMSIIGPRPPLPNEVAEYDPRHFERLEGVPGITGLWQVSRGNNISFDEMVKLDLEYMENWSLLKDMVILLKTIPAMLRGQGAF